MLEKYLNKTVIIEEKLYNSASTAYSSSGFARSMTPAGMTNILEGTLTAVDGEFIELDNDSLIAIRHIYRIRLK